MSTAVLDNSRQQSVVEPIDLKLNGAGAALSPVHTPDGGPAMAEPQKMKKPAKMKKAPRRQSVALAQASPSMLDEHPGALSKQVAVSCDATPASATIGGTTPQAALKMKKPNKMKKPPRRASLMPGQLPTESADFKPSLAPIAASGLPAGVPEDALGPMPAKPAPKPKGGNLKGKGAKRNSVANLGADPDMLAAMAEAGIAEGDEDEEDDIATTAAAPAPAAAAAPAAAPAPAAASDELDFETDV